MNEHEIRGNNQRYTLIFKTINEEAEEIMEKLKNNSISQET